MSKNLLEQTKQFLDVATYQENPHGAIPAVMSQSEAEQRITESSEFLSRAFGTHTKNTTTKVVHSNAEKYLNRYSQGKQIELHESCSGSEECKFKIGDTVETIKGGQQRGKVVDVVKKNGNVKVLHKHENGNTYSSYPSNLIAINEAEESLNKAISHILEQINVESINQLNEDTRAELLSVASDIAPYI